MAIAYFITENYIKDNTPLRGNVDPKELVPFIQDAQDMYVRPKLGSALYERLIDGIINNNLTSDEQNLLIKIRSMLVFYVVYDGLPFLWSKLNNKSTTKASGENLAVNDLNELKYLRKEIKDKAEFYSERLNEWLCDNGNLFTQYTNPTGTRPKRTGYTIDLFLGNTHEYKRKKY